MNQAIATAQGNIVYTRNFKEYQLTHDPKGHTINNTQVFSSDSQWIVYDTRNDETKITSTCCIEKVNITTGEIVKIYQTSGQTEFGPGVGAASYSPVKDQVIFIHGIKNSNKARPYGFTRRTGVAVSGEALNVPVYMDARNVFPPFTPGALRGGTHAHSWSADGEWLSFTYNDFFLESLQKQGKEVAKDLRVVGVMAPQKTVSVPADETGENNNGTHFSVVVTRVTENPEAGSDEVGKAYDEGWVGQAGYQKADGSWQKRALAFLGDTRDQKGNILTEVFIVDIPDDITKAELNAPLEGTTATRPNPPANTQQRRITFTGDRSFPGVQGVRHWLKTTPDGSTVFFLMKDDAGISQIFSVGVNGGALRQITHHPFPIQTQFNLNSAGNAIAYGADNSVWVTDIFTLESRRLTRRTGKEQRPRNGVVWSPDDRILAYNKYVAAADKNYLQVFILMNDTTSVSR